MDAHSAIRSLGVYFLHQLHWSASPLDGSRRTVLMLVGALVARDIRVSAVAGARSWPSCSLAFRGITPFREAPILGPRNRPAVLSATATTDTRRARLAVIAIRSCAAGATIAAPHRSDEPGAPSPGRECEGVHVANGFARSAGSITILWRPVRGGRARPPRAPGQSRVRLARKG